MLLIIFSLNQIKEIHRLFYIINRGTIMQHLYMNTVIKFFFLLTPFFLLSTFLSMTGQMSDNTRKRISLKVTLAIIIISMILLLIGNQIFSIFG
ncbi:MAG: MarC family protein, partial [Bacteroidota bacterium]